MIIGTTKDQLDELSSPDETLVEYARQGCDAAFALLISRHGDAVYNIARNICATPSEADELTQQTFISAYREIASMGRNTSFRIGLYRIGIEIALAGRRRRGSTTTSPPEPLPAPSDGAGRLIAPAGKWRDPTDPALERSDLAGLLREALERLDDGVRAAFVLCDLAELPVKETATLLQTTPREIRQRVHRARLMLISVLDGFFQELDA